MAKTTVTVTESTVQGSDGIEYDVTQYRTTIPKPLAEAMDFEGGEKVNWKIESGSKLSFTLTDE